MANLAGTVKITSFYGIAANSLPAFNFTEASANAKAVNLATNPASFLYFSYCGQSFLQPALSIAFINMSGGRAGTKLTLENGNLFIGIFFWAVLAATLLLFGRPIYQK
jgi:hypothetical protein